MLTDELDFAIWWLEMKRRYPCMWILELHYIYGWDVSDLAVRFDTSTTTIKNRISRARCLIEKYYENKKVVVRRSPENVVPNLD